MKLKLTKKSSIALILIAIVAGYFYFKPAKSKFNIKDFDTETVQFGDITKIITANGTINPVSVIEVGAQVSGRIERIYVDYNDKVKKGQKLAELDTSILRKSVGEAESTLKKAKANLDLAELDYRRTKELFANNYIAKVELDQAETVLKTTREEYNIAKSREATAKINLSYAFINSPVSGVVISREVDVGQTVASSFSAPVLFEIAEDLTKMQIETSIAEADIGFIKYDQDVEFTVDTFPGRTFVGKVKQIRLRPTTESNVVVYNVIINIDNKEQILMPGMTAYVSIPIDEVRSIKKVNTVALRFSPTDQILEVMGIQRPERIRGKAILYKLEGNKVKPIYAELGLSNLSQTEVKTDELSEGDVIISNSTLFNKKR
jgi:HlyD family secretion protein